MHVGQVASQPGDQEHPGDVGAELHETIAPHAGALGQCLQWNATRGVVGTRRCFAAAFGNAFEFRGAGPRMLAGMVADNQPVDAGDQEPDATKGIHHWTPAGDVDLSDVLTESGFENQAVQATQFGQRQQFTGLLSRLEILGLARQVDGNVGRVIVERAIVEYEVECVENRSGRVGVESRGGGVGSHRFAGLGLVLSADEQFAVLRSHVEHCLAIRCRQSRVDQCPDAMGRRGRGCVGRRVGSRRCEVVAEAAGVEYVPRCQLVSDPVGRNGDEQHHQECGQQRSEGAATTATEGHDRTGGGSTGQRDPLADYRGTCGVGAGLA